MSQTEQNKKTVTRFNKEFIEGGKQEVFDEIIAKEFINHTAPEGVPKGPEGVLYFFNNFLKASFPDLKVEIHEQVAESDKVVTRKSFHATHAADFMGVPATNRKVRFDVIDIIRLENGKFVEHWNILDWGSVMGQIS